MDALRHIENSCGDLQGFVIYNSLGGGAGSGLTALILEQLELEYPKKTRLGVNILPSPCLPTPIVEPYNTLMGVHSMIEKLDVSLIFEN